MAFSLERYKAATEGFSAPGKTNRFGIQLGGLGHLGYYAARRAWGSLFQKRLADASDATNPLFAVPAALSDDHVSASRLFANRHAMIASLDKNLVWAEVGTWEGAFARDILATCAPSELHLFDLDFARTVEKGYIRESDTVRFHKGASAEMLASFPDAYFDVIYIDGDHALIGVCRDADVALRKIKPNGALIFNDYIAFSHLELFPYGTVPVVNSLCHDHGWGLAGFALHPKMYCDVMLRRR